MVDDVMDLFGLKFVLNRYDNCTIRDDGQEGCRPLTTISTTYSNLVAFLHVTVFEQYVKFLDFSSYIVILQRGALVIGERIKIPVLDDALLNIRVETWY